MRNRVIQFSFLILIITTILLVGFFYYQRSVKASEMSDRLKGEILLQVEQNGEAWYVYPDNGMRYYLGRPDDAYRIMHELGIGISNIDLVKIQIAKVNYQGHDTDTDGLSDMFEDAIGTNKFEVDTDQDGYTDSEEFFNNYDPNGPAKISYDSNFSSLHQGKIFLQVEQNGEAWYISGNLRYYLGRPVDAFNVMRNFGLGITDRDLDFIKVENLGEEYYIEQENQSQELQELESPSSEFENQPNELQELESPSSEFENQPNEPANPPQQSGGSSPGLGNPSETACTDECVIPESPFCIDSESYKTCGKYDGDSCFEWSDAIDCENESICQDGACVNEPIDCIDECIINDIQCSGNGYQVCDNYDEDECYEWSMITECLQDYICSEGICNPPIQPCIDECNVYDVQCSGVGYQSCGYYDEDECLEWGMELSCNQGYECNLGECVLSGLGSSCPIIGSNMKNTILKGTSSLDPELEQAYQDALMDLFHWSMPIGTGTWLNVHPEEDLYVSAGIQYALDWLNSHGMNYNIYHNVVVPKYHKIPDWYWNLGSQEERQVALEDHVKTIMSFFGDQIPIYNVVNHIYNNNFKDNNSDNYLLTGWDRLTAVTNILTWARSANPNVELIINEDGVWVNGVSNSRTNYIQILHDLIDNDAPLDGLGLMGHFGSDWGQGAGKLPNDVLRIALEDYSQFGLPIYITEFDVSYSYILDTNPSFNPDDPFENYDSWWDYQADAYIEAFEIFQEFPLVKMVHFWDMYDGFSWLPGTGLFDKYMSPKPVYYSLENYLREAKNRQCSLN